MNAPAAASEMPYRQEASPPPWAGFALTVLVRWKRFLVLFPLVVTLGAGVVAFMLPKEYAATARLLVPESGNNLVASLLGGGVRSAASRFLGSGVQVGGFARYLALLNSDTIGLAVVDSFGLVRVYQTSQKVGPREAALKELRERSAFEVDDEYEYLRISVLDQSPERAARITNAYVSLLNTESQRLSTQSAREYGRFIGNRYTKALSDTDSLLDRTRDFQQRYGVINLEAQTTAYFEQMGRLRAEQTRLQASLEGLRPQFGPESPEIAAVEQALAEVNRQYSAAQRGSEQAFPVAREGVPTVVREYATLERDRLIQEKTLEALAPMYVASQLEEDRNTSALQVLDQARPPARKAAPKRLLIVALAALSSVVLAFAFAFAWEGWRSAARTLAQWAQEAASAHSRQV